MPISIRFFFTALGHYLGQVHSKFQTGIWSRARAPCPKARLNRRRGSKIYVSTYLLADFERLLTGRFSSDRLQTCTAVGQDHVLPDSKKPGPCDLTRLRPGAQTAPCLVFLSFSNPCYPGFLNFNRPGVGSEPQQHSGTVVACCLVEYGRKNGWKSVRAKNFARNSFFGSSRPVLMQPGAGRRALLLSNTRTLLQTPTTPKNVLLYGIFTLCTCANLKSCLQSPVKRQKAIKSEKKKEKT